MPEALAPLRMNLDFMPSPVDDRPGLLIRDSYGYSDAVLIIPPVLVSALEYFDGQRTAIELREHLVRVTGDLQVGALIEHLTETLSAAGFLEDEVYERLKEERHRDFAASPVRHPAHAGSGYPGEPETLRQTWKQYLSADGNPPPARPLLGIAAPHVSPHGGWQSYGAAYGALTPELRERTFVILGTSHYGEPDRFGLTRKPFVTPFGEARTDTALVDRLAAQAPASVLMEDYCHAVEHSIEFQVLFLQHLYGPDLRIVPLLCGSYARSIYQGGLPEDDDRVRRFLNVLGEMAAKEGDRLFWILGIDMAHMGRRYGDRVEAVAGRGRMAEVAERDRARIARIEAGDAGGFWDLVQQNHDDLKWCGSSPVYTFLKAVPQARGQLLRYDQWNIDEQSVVSFAGIAFSAPEQSA